MLRWLCVFVTVLLAAPITAANPPATMRFPNPPAQREFVLDLADILTPQDRQLIHLTAESLLTEKDTPLLVVNGSDKLIDVAELLARVDTDTQQAEYKLTESGKPLSVVNSFLGRKQFRRCRGDALRDYALAEARSDRQRFPASVDFGIITMKEEEYRAVERQFMPLERLQGEKQPYLFGEVSTTKGERTVLITRCEQGHTAAQQCANNLMSEAKPRWILLVGIAGAFPAEEYTLGDVLLANHVYDFAITAESEGKPPEPNPKGGKPHPKVAYLLKELPGLTFQQQLGAWNGEKALAMPKPVPRVADKLTDPPFYGDKDWRKKVQKGLKANFPAEGDPRPPICRVVPVGTANVLLKNTEVAKEWVGWARSVGHVEMELGGVYEAAQEAQVPVLSIRGISDVVGFRRSTAWTEFACQTAAAFARALVGSGLIGFS